MSARRLLTLLPALGLLLGATPVHAVTKLEGEYQLMLELRKSAFNRNFRWDWNSNEYDTYNNAQLRLFSTPRAGVESFVKVEAAYRPNGENDGPRPEFKYREMHLRFRRQFGKREWDTYLFSRQDRFWTDPYQVQSFDANVHGFKLEPLVYGRGDWQGIRTEYKGDRGLNLVFVVGDRSNQVDPGNYSGLFGTSPLDSLNAAHALRTDDLYLFRARRDFLKDSRLKLGLLLVRTENWNGADSLNSNGRLPKEPGRGVWAVDGHLRVLGSDVNMVYSEAYPHFGSGNGTRSEVTIGKRSTGLQLPDAAILEGEIRSIRFGTARTGFVNVVPIWFSRGPRWYNPAGPPGANQTGYLIQSYYLMPERAITLSHNFGWSSDGYDRRLGSKMTYDDMYVEFVNGFTGKLAYRTVESYSYDFRGDLQGVKHDDLIAEVQVESRLAWLRVQAKAADVGNPAAKQLFVVEQSINVTPKAKFYNRFAFGNDPDKLRKAIFTQFQYRPTGSMEMFLQYGPDYIGGGSMPVDEWSLNGGGDQIDQVKFILKGFF
ncbi:MAG: hypothetical protein U0704_14230 [Candidatus Eisenbacteria bacterium]